MLGEQRPEQELFVTLLRFNEATNAVEVGVAYGDTTIQLAKALKGRGIVYGFDIWARHGVTKQFGSFKNKEYVENRLKEAGCDNVILTQIDTAKDNETFCKLLDEYCPDGIDFAFIDGCHSYQGVAADFCAVYPRLSKTGIIAFHDTLFIDGSREFMIDLRTMYADGTFDVVDFYAGRQKATRVGISLLIKRTFPVMPDPITEVCGSPSTPAEIERKEIEWYQVEREGNMGSDWAIDIMNDYVHKLALPPGNKTINRKKFED